MTRERRQANPTKRKSTKQSQRQRRHSPTSNNNINNSSISSIRSMRTRRAPTQMTCAPPAAASSPPAPTRKSGGEMMRFFNMETQELRVEAYGEEEGESSYDSSNSSHNSNSGRGLHATVAPSSKVRSTQAIRTHRAATATVAHAASSGSSSTTATGAHGHAESAGAMKSYKPRKATHVVRKEEKEELEKQLKILQAELLGLKYRAMFPHISSCSSSSEKQTPLHPGFTGEVLRDAIKIQQLSLASVQAVISNYVSKIRVSPIQTPIRLGSDPIARRTTLQTLKDAKLAEARRFLAERTRGLDLTKHYSEEERFETDNGDFCVLQFDTTPLPNAKSVKELFDVLFFFIFNVEIKITEALGNVTIREDDESGDESISHHRLTTTNELGVQTELSTVHFSDFNEGGGMIVADFVDEDELYPYRPSERVRHDLTAVLSITPERRQVKNKHDENGPDEEEIIVTLTRWSLVKSHCPQFPVSEVVRQQMRDTLGTWTDEMLKTLRQRAADS